MAAGAKFQGWAVVDTIVTNDANNHELMVYTLSPDHTVKVLIDILAQRYDSSENDEVFTHDSIHVFNKAGAAAAVLRASSTPAELDPQATGWRVTVDANGNDCRVQVMGTAAEDVRWFGRIKVLDIEQAVV